MLRPLKAENTGCTPKEKRMRERETRKDSGTFSSGGCRKTRSGAVQISNARVT